MSRDKGKIHKKETLNIKIIITTIKIIANTYIRLVYDKPCWNHFTCTKSFNFHNNPVK